MIPRADNFKKEATRNLSPSLCSPSSKYRRNSHEGREGSGYFFKGSRDQVGRWGGG